MSQKIPETITEDELLLIIKNCKRKHHKLAFALAFYECMRISEIVGLKKAISKCCEADIEKMKIKGQHQVLRCGSCRKELHIKKDLKRHKTEWQIPPLIKECIDMSRRLIYIKNAKGEKDRNIPIAPDIAKRLTLKIKGLPIKCGERALEMKIKAIAKEVLNKDIHFHCLRHSGTTHYLNEMGWDIRYLQQMLGHANLNTTQLYAQVEPRHLIDKMWEKK